MTAVYKESKQDREQRTFKLGSGQLCFWCWSPVQDPPILCRDKGARLGVCPQCAERQEVQASILTGMRWWAGSDHNPFSNKNRRRAKKEHEQREQRLRAKQQ